MDKAHPFALKILACLRPVQKFHLPQEKKRKKKKKDAYT